jgi:hypothetical protein
VVARAGSAYLPPPMKPRLPVRLPTARTPARPVAGVALAALALLAGCTDKVDRLAKERIFSPEEPAAELQRAKAPLAVKDAATDPAVFKRLLTMDRLEATRRLGGHRATTTLRLKWTRAGRTVTLAEEDRLQIDAEGRFRATSTNDEDAGLEVVWVDGKAFARSRYGPFRTRRIDRAQQDEWRNQATPGLATTYALFGRRLRLAPLGSGTRGGRPGERFSFVLGEPWGEPDARADVPPVSFGQQRIAGEEGLKAGPDADTARRLDFEQRRVPESVSGELFVDEATGVVLQASARSRRRRMPSPASPPPRT